MTNMLRRCYHNKKKISQAIQNLCEEYTKRRNNENLLPIYFSFEFGFSTIDKYLKAHTETIFKK